MEIAKYVIFDIRDCVLEIDKMLKSDEADPIHGNHIIHSQGKFDLLNPQFALHLFILQLRGFIKLSRMLRRISESTTSETVAMASSSESYMISLPHALMNLSASVSIRGLHQFSKRRLTN